jgi:hypothetical protein
MTQRYTNPRRHNTYRAAALGLDLGHSQHPSALTLLTEVQQIQSHHIWADPSHPKLHHWVVSYAHVFPHYTAFSEVAAETIAVAANFAALQPKASLFIVADSTGLGRPIIEMLHSSNKAETRRTGRLEGVTFTAGHEYSRYAHPNLPVDMYNVPKLTLLNSLSLAIESGLLKIPANLPERETLLAQLAALEVHYPSRAQNTRGPSAAHAGLDTSTSRHPIVRLNPDALRADGPTLAHADLVMSLALAAWRLHLYQRPSVKLIA